MMTRAALALCVGIACCAALASAADDPIKKRLIDAKEAYDGKVKKYEQAVGEWLTKREDAARKAGDKKKLDEVKADRKAYEETGALPTTAPADLKKQLTTARSVFEAAMTTAVKEYTKVKMDDEAAAVEKALEAFRKGTDSWAALFPPGVYAASYDGGVKASVELQRDGTFVRVRDNKRYPGTVSFVDGKLVLKSDEFVEVWTATSGGITVAHWWPANTYPKGKAQSSGTAVRAKD